MNKISIDGVNYIPEIKAPEDCTELEYVIIRTYSAGVHAGYLKEHNGKEVTLLNSRRIWKWAGANSLSELATNGTSCPNECKFSVPTTKIILTEAIEIISTTPQGKYSIINVKEWAYE